MASYDYGYDYGYEEEAPECDPTVEECEAVAADDEYDMEMEEEEYSSSIVQKIYWLAPLVDLYAARVQYNGTWLYGETLSGVALYADNSWSMVYNMQYAFAALNWTVYLGQQFMGSPFTTVFKISTKAHILEEILIIALSYNENKDLVNLNDVEITYVCSAIGAVLSALIQPAFGSDPKFASAPEEEEMMDEYADAAADEYADAYAEDAYADEYNY